MPAPSPWFPPQPRLHLAVWLAAASLTPLAGPLPAQTLETASVRFTFSPDNGSYEILDKSARVTWKSNPYEARFGEVTVRVEGQPRRLPLNRCQVEQAGRGLTAVFAPRPDLPAAKLRVRVQPLADERALEVSYQADPALAVESVRLLDEALWTTDTDQGYVVVPVREGLLIPADSQRHFHHRLDTYAYEGCHLAMLGVVKRGAAALLTWHDPYVLAELRSAVTNQPGGGGQVLSTSLALRQSAKAFRLHLLGPGDYVTIAQAYRPVAQEKGWLVPWSEKLKGHPQRTNYFGASNFKLWSLLSRSMSEDSSQELSVKVNWTFDEAAQVAEHLKRDLKLDKVLFILGGWIHRGYDNQHPDILPTAPECGGDAAFREACRRIRAQGYILSLHDNYQDIYRDSPSWNEDYIMKTPDGRLARGGKWAGGLAYLTCARKALELAQRPQNLPAVKALSDADSYFIDTTYAAGLQECFDPKHPLTRLDDMRWKQALSDYARALFGSFGSECGREWAIPHADFFEGFTGVSGTYYHNKELVRQLGATPVPVFEMVFRDCIAAYGKYGYDPAQAAEYVLHHLTLGRPLHYHSVPPGLYWKREARPNAPLALRPAVLEVKADGPRRFRISYRWTVDKAPTENWRVFVHFTDAGGQIKFQNDHDPLPPTSQWPTGEVRQGPFTIAVPEGLSGTFHVRMGLFQSPNGARALLAARQDADRTCLVGRLTVRPDTVEFEPVAAARDAAEPDAAVFTRADGGWAEGLHPLDRFLKNTHEILSPLNEITAQMLLTQHRFLTPDRLVRRSVFGQGPAAVEVLANASPRRYRHTTKSFGEVELPPWGFVVESPTFVAFHALSWNGLRYDAPVLFTLRSLDGQPLAQSEQVRVFHGFGDARLRLGDRMETVPKEAVVRRTAR